MRTNYSYIYCFFVLLLAFQSAFGQNEATEKTAENISVEQSDKTTQDDLNQSNDWRINSLMKQAKELFEAYDKEDCLKFVEMSHPNVYKKDGKAKFYDEVRLVIESRSISYNALPSSVEAPTEIFEFDKQLFAVVTYKLAGIKGTSKEKTLAVGSMVGISENGGESWKFVKGVAFNESFPNVAGMISIPYPMEKSFVNDIEQ